MRAPERLTATRVVATPAALDHATWPAGVVVLRTAPDEAIALAGMNAVVVNDPHAIIERETALFGVWVEAGEALDLLERECAWEVPHERPSFAQGAVAGLPVKVWFEADQVLFVVPAPFAADFVERCR